MDQLLNELTAPNTVKITSEKLGRVVVVGKIVRKRAPSAAWASRRSCRLRFATRDHPAVRPCWWFVARTKRWQLLAASGSLCL